MKQRAGLLLGMLVLAASVGFAEAKAKTAIATPAEPATQAAQAADKEAKPAEVKKEEKVELKTGVDAKVKAAIEAADKANTAAKKAGFEWFMEEKSMSEHLQDAIKAANADDNEKALKLAEKVEAAGKAGQAQAEVAKKAGPRF